MTLLKTTEEFARRRSETSDPLPPYWPDGKSTKKDLTKLKPVREYFQKHDLTHPEVYQYAIPRDGPKHSPLGPAEKSLEEKQALASIYSAIADAGMGSSHVFMEWEDGVACISYFKDEPAVWWAIPEYPDHMRDLINHMRAEWAGLTKEKKNAVSALHDIHNSLFLAFLLASGHCSPSDYAITLFSGVLGKGPITDQAQILGPKSGEPKRHNDLNQILFKDILAAANTTVEYLRLCENPIIALIEGGETSYVEFKESFRWDTRQNKNNNEITTAVVKTIVAFMNSHEGTLILGVADNKNIVGIDHDRYKNEDTYNRALVETISKRIGPNFADGDSLKINFHQIGHRKVVSIKCIPPVPSKMAYLDWENVYIRQGPTSQKLSTQEAVALSKRFEAS